MYIEYVERLRERTNYVVAEAAEGDPVLGGCWACTKETSEGGAIISMSIDKNLERLEKAGTRLQEQGIHVEMIVNENEDEFILVNEKDEQIPFGTVMKAIFD